MNDLDDKHQKEILRQTQDDKDLAEKKLELQTKQRESKKRKRMPVSGKHVFTIKKILDKKES